MLAKAISQLRTCAAQAYRSKSGLSATVISLNRIILYRAPARKLYKRQNFKARAAPNPNIRINRRIFRLVGLYKAANCIKGRISRLASPPPPSNIRINREIFRLARLYKAANCIKGGISRLAQHEKPEFTNRK